MHRPPHNHLPQGGGAPGGSGGAYPQSSSFLQSPNINPQLYHLQLQQQQQQAIPPQFFFQVPNPSFPSPFIHPQFQNLSFLNPCIQGPAASLPTQNFVPSPQSQNPSFQGPKVSLERIERAVLKAQTDLVTAAENVSAWKVSQAALLALQVDSWGSLGFQLQDVPSLKRLLVTEGKVNAFIHCFVAAQRITSLYDLEVAICKNEGIENFEELGLGPLSCHPLAQHYFSISSDTVEIFKLPSEEIISLLHSFLDKHNMKKISVEEFLDFLVEQKSLTSKGKLGVRIQSLGLHISCIREAKRAERTILAKSLDKLKRGTEERILKDQALPRMHVEKKMLDKRFDSISGRIKSFSSLCNDVGGKHTRFDDSSFDEYDDSDDDNYVKHVDTGLNKNSFHDNVSSQNSSKCPYPSTSEEMRRLGLKIDIGEKVNHTKDPQVDIGGYFGKKRKRKREENNGNIMKKFLRKDEAFNVDLTMDTDSLLGHSLDKFITTWKEACLQHSASEVLDLMLNFYMPSIAENKKGRIKKIFSSYPGAGLLDIAVTSIRRGLLNSVYDTVQAFGDFGSAPCAGIIEIGSSVKDPQSNVDEENDVHGYRATVDDIVKCIAKFFGLGIVMPRDREISFGKQFEKLSDCEKWLMTQFSVKDFSLLGHGSFCSFLEQHASLLPSDMCTLFNENLPEQSCVQVGMLQQQLGLLLSQAQSNLIDKDDVSKSDCSLVLSRQFPTINFCMVGNEQEKCFSDLIKRQKDNLDSTCVLYSVPLLGKRLAGDVLAYCEALASEASYAKTESGQRTCSHGNVSGKDALECLLKVPMLSDLLTWSHWDVIYAPALGPLSDWLLNEANAKELLCVATVDGKFIRIDHSATVDDFLEAMIQCSPFQVALKLLSLLSLYGGVGSAPLSLLKCYVQQAIDVIIRNYADSMEVSNMRASLSHKNASCGQGTGHNVLNVDIHSIEMPQSSQVICEESSLSESIFGINRAVTDVARFILQCLDYLPSEFRCFGLEILVSGFKCVAKDAYSVILGQCVQTYQRIMLHNIGLSLGIAEWVNDFHEFNLTAGADLFMASLTSNKNFLHTRSGRTVNHAEDATDKIISGEHHMPATTNENPELPDRGRGSTMPNGYSNGKDTDDADGGDIMKNNIIHDANCVVESIRREEFGLDPNLKYTESCMLKKQHARLGRALHCLSQELYSQDSHLLLELVQNADDNIYPEDVDPTLVFILQDSGIIVLNNELGFSAENIRALCDIGNSTKKGSGAGYIGHKGIGFKSVFRITDAPEIHSNGFHVKFDISEGQIGFVLPTVIQPCDVNVSKLLLSGENLLSDGNQWNTCIVLPFRSKSREGTGLSSIMSMFSDLHPSLLLFLHRLRCIKFKNMLSNSLVDMRREILGNGIVRVSHGQVTMTWLVISKKLPATLIRPDVQGTEIAVAFTLEECENGEYKPHLSQQPVFAFLPLRSYGLKFILQGDFVLPSSREEVDGDSAWNQWLLSEFPALFVSAEQSFCALPCFQKCPGKAVTIYMGFVPVGGEVYGFFSRLPHLIISKLRTSHCLLLDAPDLTWVLPCRVLRGWNEQGRMLLSDSLLQKHLGLGYLNKDIELPDALANALGVQEYGPRVLVEFISSVCRSSDGIQSLGLEWLSLWLSVFHSTLPTHSSGHLSVDSRLEYELVDSLKKIPFIPLSDGSYSSVANGTIWLPCDLSSGIEGRCSAKDFPGLFAKLRTVSPFLLSVASKGTYEVGEARRESVLHMLYKLGVQQSSAHEIIKSHILVALSKDIYTDEDRHLMVEYLSFIFIHFQYECLKCSSEKVDIISEIRKRAVLLTNHGYKCPIEEPVHFGKEYKNPVSVDKLIIDVDGQWPEVDVAYLEHHSTRSMPSGLLKWRDFFQELGVTDFVRVTCIKKSTFDLPLDITPNEGSNIAAPVINDWASPELLNFLSTFSSKKCREKCIYLLEVLDRMWDDSYNAYSRSCIIFKSNEGKKTMESSFLKSLREIEWIASSMDQDLHQSKDLFYDCDEVRSILGNSAPYVVPQVTSKLLLKDLGFKTEVSLSDALEILRLWRMSKTPFLASTLQMSKFYSFIFDGLSKLEVQMKEELISSSFIFVPFLSTSRSNNVVYGLFLSPKELYWHDPTGCADKIREVLRLCSSVKENNCLPCYALATIYPGLSDFFVNVCGVPKSPSFDIYLQILQQLSSISLPSQAANVVFRVFERWADDVKSGSVTPYEVVELKESLYKLESTVLPTLQDRWVSLHPSFGLICWPDDDELKQQFKHSDGIDFLHFGELSEEDQKILSGRVAMFMRDLGVPALSEVVSREAISYGTEDNREKAALINWVLPYAQRYLLKFCPDVYLNFKQLQSEKLGQLQVVVVDKLFYRNCLKGRGTTSKRRSECNCLLQGTILYSTQTADSHSIFLELSRLFFNGSTELLFANFLHMIVTMAESGSSLEQTEFFIVNSQKVPPLPVEEPVWSFSPLPENPKLETPQTILTPTNINQNSSTSQNRPDPSPNWPPTGWKTAPDVSYARANYHLTRPWKPSMKESTTTVETITQSEELPIPAEIDGKLIVGDSTTEASPSFESSNNMDATALRQFQQPPDEVQAQKTGRLGEVIAYNYFVGKLGSGNVKWVNEETETGLPYDLIVTGGEGSGREYVEVKATRSSSKDWFEISPREWQSAVEMGDSYCIAHVLLGAKKASIVVLKNPLRLCQRNALQLALLMSRQQRDQSATAS